MTATPSSSVEKERELPPLPEAKHFQGRGERFGATVVGLYTAEQMREYARSCLASEGKEPSNAQALLADLAACKSCDPNKNRSNAGRWRTVNVPAALWERIERAAMAQQVPQQGESR